MTKLAQGRTEQRKIQSEMKGPYLKMKEPISTPIKIQSNPEFHFFESLQNLMDPPIFEIVIKLLHLYNEGVLSHAEFVEMSEPFFGSNLDLFDYLRTITYSKMMNRRQFSLINKPLAELDLTSIIV